MWVLYCDLLCINYDGSIIDACIGALTAALSTRKLYAVSEIRMYLYFVSLIVQCFYSPYSDLT